MARSRWARVPPALRACVSDHLLRAAAAASRVTTAAGPNESDKAVERLGSLEEELSLQRDASRWLEPKRPYSYQRCKQQHLKQLLTTVVNNTPPTPFTNKL